MPMAAPDDAKSGAGALAALPEDVLLDVFSRLRTNHLFLLASTSRWWLRLFTDDDRAFLRRLLLSPEKDGPDRVTALPDAVLAGVFSRVRDVKSLFRCAATCKRWLRLFTDRDFLLWIWPETDAARLRGVFLKGPNPDIRRIFVPRPNSRLGFDDCHRITSVALDDRRDERDLLASSRGLILRHILTRTCCFGSHTDIVVSDPITGATDKFGPPPDCRCLHVCVSGHAIFTAADLSNNNERHQRLLPTTTRPHSTFSTLLLIGYHMDDERLHQHVHSYSGVTGQWSPPGVVRHCARLRMTGARDGVVHKGAAHWLYADETISISVPHDQRTLYMLRAEAATGRVSLTKLPIKAASGLPYACVTRDGKLSVVCIHSTRIDVWVQQRDEDDSGATAAWLLGKMFGENNWVLSQVIQLVPSTAPGNENFMSCKWFHFNKGAMMAVYGGNGVFVLDLKTKVMEKIMDLSDCAPSYGYYMCVPYEMDLPEFFLGKLVGGRDIDVERDTQVGCLPW